MSRFTRILPWTIAATVGAALLTWITAVYLRRPPETRLPYYRRNDWVSKTLLDLSDGPKGLAALHVPEGFQVELASTPGLVTYPVFATLDDRGRLFVCESNGKNIPDQEMTANPEFRVRLLEDSDGDGVFDKGKLFADKLSMCMGAVWYRGALYITAPPDFLRLQDTNDDGVADQREVILTGWPLRSNGTTLHGPYLGPDGWMYFTYNLYPYKIKTKEGKVLEGPGGRVFRCRPDGSGLEWFVGGGFDNGIEIVFTPAGETIGTMTYYTTPHMGLRDALLHFVEGGVYPKILPIVHKYKRTGEVMPALTKFARIAPCGLAIARSAGLGPAYRGNLFSAQFNPHRVQRHILQRDGATFHSTDEDLLTSEDPDFHPTDVLEDADGSLLVVETGAWYLHSCPVSRIAKPQFIGAIYRVRRKGAHVGDPWGKKLALESWRPAELVRYLGDPRPAVRDKAVESLVLAGEAAIGPLIRARETERSPEVRAAAVFALARIAAENSGAARAAEAVRNALSDRDFVVRIAAARMVGLARDGAAIERLLEMVVRDDPSARRQAATALGQIGDARAVPALLAAAAVPADRFAEHSIIYSLIILRTPQPLIEAVTHPDAKVRNAALIALDQMDGAPLRREHLAPSLMDSDSRLRRTALWIISRHPDWSAAILKVLRVRLREEVPADEAATLRETIVSFCGNAEVQKALAEALSESASNSRRQLFVLDTFEQCAAKPFPGVWTDQLRQLVRNRQRHSDDAGIRARVLSLVRSRQVAGLEDDLERLSLDAAESRELRLLALGVLVSRRPALAEANVQFLLGLLQPEIEADLRLSASQVFGKARLSETQLLTLARTHVPRADPLVLPNLLDAFRAATGEAVGKALVNGLFESTHPADGIAAERIPEMLPRFPSSVRMAAVPLLARIQKEKESRAQRLEGMMGLLRSGDPGRGRMIFFGKKAGCSSCHTIMAEGADVGPDLTGIGAIRTGLDLLEAIVFPSASFVPGHEIYRVETPHEVYTGVQGESNPQEVVIISGPRDLVRVPRKDIVSMRPSLVSLMPDGYANNLTQTELSDLLAFLQSQKYRAPSAATSE